MYRLMGYFKFNDEMPWQRFNDKVLEQIKFEEEDYEKVSAIMKQVTAKYYLVTLVKV